MNFYALAGTIYRGDEIVVAAYAMPASSFAEAMRIATDRFGKDYSRADGWHVEVAAFEIPDLALTAYVDIARVEKPPEFRRYDAIPGAKSGGG